MKITKVRVNRYEGRIDECGDVVFKGEDAEEMANEYLRKISLTAPKNAGYHKTGVAIVIEIQSRHDVKFLDIDGTVREHALRWLRFCDTWPHLTEEYKVEAKLLAELLTN